MSEPATLAAFTTLRLGGPAGRLIEVTSEEETLAALREGGDQLILAGGSNVVIADEGFPGTVILLRQRGLSVSPPGAPAAADSLSGGPAPSGGPVSDISAPGGAISGDSVSDISVSSSAISGDSTSDISVFGGAASDGPISGVSVSGGAVSGGSISGISAAGGSVSGDEVLLTVAAGHPWDEVVAAAVSNGWSGIESLSGIPGSAGATPIQNVGAYGQEVAETITSVRAYDRTRDEIVTLPASACGFAYRTSIFKHNPRYVVLSVTFRLLASPSSRPIAYAELARALGVAVGETAPLEELRAAVLKLRAGKGMVLDPADPDTYSVGSFFTNPVVSAESFARVAAVAADLSLGPPPSWPAGPDVKLSAAWLIERAGFAKGHGDPATGVTLSGKHTLALTNRGTGTTAALLDLAREIRVGVESRFGVALHPEPVLVNCALS